MGRNSCSLAWAYLITLVPYLYLADRIRPLIESEKERLRKKFWHRQLTACPCVEYSVHLFIEVEDNTIFLPRIRC